MISALVDYLARFYQDGNLTQVEAITRSMLAAVPDDRVALQFLGLTLFQQGYLDDAQKTFERVAADQDHEAAWDARRVCEPAHVASFRAATRMHSGLAEGWYQIALALNSFGFQKPASRAFQAALAARGLTQLGNGSADACSGLSIDRRISRRRELVRARSDPA